MPTMVKGLRLVPRDSGVSAVTVSAFRRLAVAIASRDRLTSGLAGLPTDFAGLPTDFAGLPTDFAGLPTDFADLPAVLLVGLRSVVRREFLTFMLRLKRGRSNELPAPKRIGVLLKPFVATRNVDFLALYCLSGWLSELVFASRPIAIFQHLGHGPSARLSASRETPAHRFARSHRYSVERSMSKIAAVRALSPPV